VEPSFTGTKDTLSLEFSGSYRTNSGLGDLLGRLARLKTEGDEQPADTQGRNQAANGEEEQDRTPRSEGEFELHFGVKLSGELPLDQLASLPVFLVRQGFTCPGCSEPDKQTGHGRGTRGSGDPDGETVGSVKPEL